MGPHRVNIINTLQLIAAPEDQLQYQRAVPTVNVARELVNQWFDDFYHPGSAHFLSEFSGQEMELLAEFNRFYDERADSLPDRLPKLLETGAWSAIVAKANEILDACGWRGVDARYEL